VILLCVGLSPRGVSPLSWQAVKTQPDLIMFKLLSQRDRDPYETKPHNQFGTSKNTSALPPGSEWDIVRDPLPRAAYIEG